MNRFSRGLLVMAVAFGGLIATPAGADRGDCGAELSAGAESNQNGMQLFFAGKLKLPAGGQQFTIGSDQRIPFDPKDSPFRHFVLFSHSNLSVPCGRPETPQAGLRR